MNFKLVDSNRYYLANTNDRFLHLGSAHYGLREYMCFADRMTSQIYIEEITGGSMQFIDDDSLAQGLSDFFTEVGVLDLKKPLIPDAQWYKKPGAR